VHRLTGEQHHVVGDVDHVADRPLAGGHQARLEPGRRGPDLHVLEQARREARAQVGRLDRNREPGDRVARGVLIVAPRRRRERRPRRRVHLARHAVDAQAVRPVGRDLELEHRACDRQHVGERRADRQRRVELHDPVVIGPDAELVLGEDHPA
jgi:hypothetical protein